MIERLTGTCTGRIQDAMLKDVVRSKSHLRGFALDSNYVAELRKCHGGVPVRQYFSDGKRRLHRCGRFVNFHTDETLSGPGTPWFADPQKDSRLILNRHNLDATANTSEGRGPRLMLFAALYRGAHSPDQMMCDHLDYLCFNHRGSAKRPSVAIWHNDLGVDEALRCESEGLDYLDFDERNCTTPVAESFEAFAAMLQETP
ncbi:hypothetical protein Pan44_44870 [Caulifigura coniformis]|uniref:Uncharacterized protein n=1 Tax=Caulifigura coniformis TaxID=2527983 RepID=A0A517SJY2_9PLAN|nr:hypothetical protein [Caulifigura coniformis]QDT56433.1 hypothetical protein Pan44_44870 [Caulifigura coniformis]